jgi:hypothetical protein
MMSGDMHFMIEDETHCEQIGDFQTMNEAKALLKYLANVPWGTHPNLPLCGSGVNCDRHYILITGKYDDATWIQLSRTSIFRIDANGIVWDDPTLID